jgi:hypothetical protein
MDALHIGKKNSPSLKKGGLRVSPVYSYHPVLQNLCKRCQKRRRLIVDVTRLKPGELGDCPHRFSFSIATQSGFKAGWVVEIIVVELKFSSLWNQRYFGQL